MLVRRILCSIDFEPCSERAYDYAWVAAERYRAELVLFHAIDPGEEPLDPHLAWAPGNVLCERHKAYVHEVEARLRELGKTRWGNGVCLSATAQYGPARDRILGYAREAGIDLLVMGTHGRRGLARLMRGSVAETVLRRAPCPVLIVQASSRDFGASKGADLAVPVRRILCGTDLSATGEISFQHALSVAEEQGADLTLVHVIEPHGGVEVARHRVADAQQRLDRHFFIAGSRKCRLETEVRVGRASEQLARMAEERNFDLMVLGARRRSALESAAFGSTTEQVVRRGPCPVLAVRA